MTSGHPPPLAGAPVRPKRDGGQLALDQYSPIGDGRSVAVVGMDGSADWWGGTSMDAPPLFDRLLGGRGRFSLTPVGDFTATRRYRPDSNVLETVFVTAQGRARVTESLNSGLAGRLPWNEFGRRVEGLAGEVAFAVRIALAEDLKCGLWREDNVNAHVAHAQGLIATLRHDAALSLDEGRQGPLTGSLRVRRGERAVLGLLANRDRPLVIMPLASIDGRIDESDAQWRAWSNKLTYAGLYGDSVRRSALALKLLLYSPSGAIAAAATSSLPECIGGPKNFDYRLAWVRDVAYSIKAFLEAGGAEEAQAAFSWLLETIDRHGPGVHVCYTLDGERAADERISDLPGYRGSRPVRVGNRAARQRQLGIYGDVMQTAALFVAKGHVLDLQSRRVLAHIADLAAEQWSMPDSGIWELVEEQHYTASKIACWAALHHAVDMAEQGHLDGSGRERWAIAREQILGWVDAHAWSASRHAYVMFPGSEKLDAALLLGPCHGFPRSSQLTSTLRAIERELKVGPFLYRYSDVKHEEGAFLACSFWYVQALVRSDRLEDARHALDQTLARLANGHGVFHEMVDPVGGAMLGNFPQGLSHLGLIHAATAVSQAMGLPA